MHGIKVLLFVVIAAALLAAGTFTFVPSTRPDFVKKWFRQATGFTPAKTPTEALDKFREAIKKRDYETAAEYCDKDYKEQLLKAAPQAKKLGDAIDSLVYNMDNNGVVNPSTKLTLYLLEPFPKTFSYDVKEKGDTAVATLTEGETLKTERPLPIVATFLERHTLMLGSLLPVPYAAYDPVTFRAVALTSIELVKDEKGHWKLKIPVTKRLRDSVEELRQKGTNYANAVRQVSDKVKNDASTKAEVQAELERALDESK